MPPRALIHSAVAAVLVIAACTSSTDGPKSTGSTSPAQGATGPAGPAATTLVDWPTYHGTPDRHGVSTSMPTAIGNPKVRKSIKLDAAVYGSPIVVNHRIIVATENNSVYAFDTFGRVLWHSNFGAPAHLSNLPCGNINPSGITGTPVYSAKTGLIYFVVEHDNPVRHTFVAIRWTSGLMQFRIPLTLPGTSQDAMQQRGALNLAGGRVWVAWGGRAGDCGNYKGRVMGIPETGAGSSVIYTVPTTREAGIWTPPGPTYDSAGHLYVAVGNGESGVGDPYDFSDSVLELNTSAHLVSSFSPSTWATDNAADLDLGSQGPALLHSYVFIAGKSGKGYVLKRDALGGIGGQVSTADVCRSFGGTAVNGTTVYVPCDDGIRAIQIDAAGTIHNLWHAGGSIRGAPVVGGGRIWSLDQNAGVLYGLNPSTGASVGQVSIGATTRFATPALYGHLVLIGTLTGLTIVTTS